MRKKTLQKINKLRRWLLLPAWLLMAGTAVYYLVNYRQFVVDDTLFASEIREASQKYGLDSRLVRAVIYEESKFRPGTVGKAGEIGLMQVMPDKAAVDWARAHKVPCPEPGLLFSPRINLEIGCWYLSEGLRRFRDYKHATELALARYNAGITRAKSWTPEDKNAPVIDNIKFPGTRRYVQNIMERYERYCREENLVSRR